MILRHWKVLALLAVVLVLGVSWCAESRHADAMMEKVEEAERRADVWRGRAVADSLALIELRARAARADTVVKLRVDTFEVRVKEYLALPDTASVETVRAVADSTISACRSALSACAIARSADADVAFGLEVVNADLRGEVASLREANAALKEASQPSSIIPDIVLVGGGCALGYALEGLRGCGKGAGGGLVVVVGYRGVRSLLESVR